MVVNNVRLERGDKVKVVEEIEGVHYRYPKGVQGVFLNTIPQNDYSIKFDIDKLDKLSKLETYDDIKLSISEEEFNEKMEVIDNGE